MTRKPPTKRVDRSQATIYLEKARAFRADAENMLELGSDFSGNGIAVMSVHAAIAYSDSISIRARGVKSVSGDHTDAVDVLQSSILVRSMEDKRAINALRYILQRKDEVSYTANLVRADDAHRILEKLASFASWAEARFEQLG